MKNSTKYLIAGGSVVGIGGGYVLYRKLRQIAIAKKVVEEYEKDKLIIGPMLYMAAFGKVPRAPLDMTQVNAAALAIAEMVQPVLSFKRGPSENDVIAFAKSRAITVAQKDPQGLALLALQEGGTIVSRLQETFGTKK